MYTATPSAPRQCERVALSWSGAVPPYKSLTVTDEGKGYIVWTAVADKVYYTSAAWTNTFPAGTKFTFAVKDYLGTFSAPAQFTVQAGLSADCQWNWAGSPDPASVTVGAVGATTVATTATTVEPSASTIEGLSSTIEGLSASTSSASASSAGGASKSNASGSHTSPNASASSGGASGAAARAASKSSSNTGAIAGGVIGGACAILLPQVAFFFLRRRTGRRRRDTSGDFVVDRDPQPDARSLTTATSTALKIQYNPLLVPGARPVKGAVGLSAAAATSTTVTASASASASRDQARSLPAAPVRLHAEDAEDALFPSIYYPRWSEASPPSSGAPGTSDATPVPKQIDAHGDLPRK